MIILLLAALLLLDPCEDCLEPLPCFTDTCVGCIEDCMEEAP